MNAVLMLNNDRAISPVARNRAQQRGSLANENSVTGIGRFRNVRRNSAHITIAGTFFVPAIACCGGRHGETFACAGPLTSRSANPAQSAPPIR